MQTFSDWHQLPKASAADQQQQQQQKRMSDRCHCSCCFFLEVLRSVTGFVLLLVNLQLVKGLRHHHPFARFTNVYNHTSLDFVVFGVRCSPPPPSPPPIPLSTLSLLLIFYPSFLPLVYFLVLCFFLFNFSSCCCFWDYLWSCLTNVEFT